MVGGDGPSPADSPVSFMDRRQKDDGVDSFPDLVVGDDHGFSLGNASESQFVHQQNFDGVSFASLLLEKCVKLEQLEVGEPGSSMGHSFDDCLVNFDESEDERVSPASPLPPSGFPESASPKKRQRRRGLSDQDLALKYAGGGAECVCSGCRRSHTTRSRTPASPGTPRMKAAKIPSWVWVKSAVRPNDVYRISTKNCYSLTDILKLEHRQFVWRGFGQADLVAYGTLDEANAADLGAVIPSTACLADIGVGYIAAKPIFIVSQRPLEGLPMKFDTDSPTACDTDPYCVEDSPKLMTSPETPTSYLSLAYYKQPVPLLRLRGGGA